MRKISEAQRDLCKELDSFAVYDGQYDELDLFDYFQLLVKLERAIKLLKQYRQSLPSNESI